MKHLTQAEQRLTDSHLQPYEPTTLALEPFEQWIEDWQRKLADLNARRAEMRLQ